MEALLNINQDYTKITVQDNENWKTVGSFPKYEVSNLGNIRNKFTLKNLSKNTLRDGYIRIGLCLEKDGKQKLNSLHRVVAETFIPNPEKKKTVNHKNHDKLDNRVENLEWATSTEQNNHKRKVSQEKKKLISSRKVWRIDKITNEKLELYETMTDAAKWIFDQNLTTSKEKQNITNICAVCRKRRGYKTAFGFKWAYDDISNDIYANEIWKPIPKHLINNVEGYHISCYGRVKNRTGRISNGYISNDYRIISVGKNSYKLHRLVAQTFLPNYFGKSIVNHKDLNKQNSSLYNLEWVTFSENSRHYHKKDIGIYKENTTNVIKIVQTQIEAREYIKNEFNINIDRKKISTVLNNKRKSIQGFVFKYI